MCAAVVLTSTLTDSKLQFFFHVVHISVTKKNKQWVQIKEIQLVRDREAFNPQMARKSMASLLNASNLSLIGLLFV